MYLAGSHESMVESQKQGGGIVPPTCGAVAGGIDS